MTDSLPPAPRAPGKRDRLIAAARETIYRQGIEKTTLADIAAAAGVPLGNVYYYFKTKQDIVEAVVESHLVEAREMLAALDDAYESPRDRLKALFGALTQQADQIARYGCPHGTLCLELDKRAGAPDLAARLMREPVDWARRQFAALGCPDADALAIEVIARYQGVALLSSTFRDPTLMTREAARVATWLDTTTARFTPNA
jgi:TetR/AcrR family transcriptional regulator, transcriptional repressor for nem operon